MDVIYALLIIKGLKTYAEVPGVIKERVANVLRSLGVEELIIE